MLDIFFSTSLPLITLYFPFTITVGTPSNTQELPSEFTSLRAFFAFKPTPNEL